MKSLSFYVLRQITGPVSLFVLLMTIVVWLTQSLRLLDLVINRGQSAGTFAYLTLLMLPSMLNAIVPIAFFAGTLYALHKLNTDSELAVMWAAGFSRTQLAAPVLVLAGVAMAITYACSLYLMPLGQRTMKDKVYDIRADIGAAILQEGQFSTPADGLTVFIRQIDPDGRIRGILVHDNRNRQRPITYLAESGVLAQTPNGARLVMYNGNIQQSSKAGAQLSVLEFNQYAFDLDQFGSPQRTTTREMNERYLPELLAPNFATKADEDRYGRIFFAEAHNRLTSALYCIAFALIALAAAAQGHMGRTSYTVRILSASVGAAALRMLGYGVQNWATKDPWLVPLLYVLPIGAATLACVLFLDSPILGELFSPPRTSKKASAT